ncbi:MAG: hypothetical protein AABX11_03910 [Nanoarchaeota archaeon]
MKIEQELKDCFRTAEKNEKAGTKHKGLLARSPNQEEAKGYIEKAKRELELCSLYKEKGFDYKLPEEWFYILYYCAIAILAKFGVESRSQRYTALFLKYVKEKGVIDYDNEFIAMIIVHVKKGEVSHVDKREEARYGHLIKIEGIEKEYEETTQLCKRAIFQAEEIVFSNKEFKVPDELLGMTEK